MELSKETIDWIRENTNEYNMIDRSVRKDEYPDEIKRLAYEKSHSFGSWDGVVLYNHETTEVKSYTWSNNTTVNPESEFSEIFRVRGGWGVDIHWTDIYDISDVERKIKEKFNLKDDDKIQEKINEIGCNGVAELFDHNFEKEIMEYMFED